MNTYETLKEKMIGLAFILGPLVMLTGTILFIMGVGVTPFGTDSWVDGVFLTFGYVIMIPVFLTLANMLGNRAPFLAMLGAVLGLSWGFSTIPAAARLLQMDIIQAGLNESIWNVMGQTAGWAPLFLGSVLGLLAPIVLGIGFARKGGASRRTAGLLIFGGLLHVIAIAGGAEITFVQTHVIPPLAGTVYLMALAPIGFQYLSGKREVDALNVATA